MEEIAIDMPHNGRQMVRMARSKTFPQRTSTGQGNNRQRFSSILSFPATWYSSENAIHQEGCSSVPSFPTQSDEGSASYQEPDAGDASRPSDPEVLASLEKPSAGTSNGKKAEIYEEEPIPIKVSEDETNGSKCFSL